MEKKKGKKYRQVGVDLVLVDVICQILDLGVVLFIAQSNRGSLKARHCREARSLRDCG